jgi:hypothetical protein
MKSEWSYIKLLSKSSLHFIEQAKNNDGIKKQYYLLASILTSYVILEAYVNRICSTLHSSEDLFPHEKALLKEKELFLAKGEFKEKTAHPPTLKKALFLLRKFSRKDTKHITASKKWRDVKDCEEFRNNLIHPKGIKVPTITTNKAKEFRTNIINFVDYLCLSIFGGHAPIR